MLYAWILSTTLNKTLIKKLLRLLYKECNILPKNLVKYFMYPQVLTVGAQTVICVKVSVLQVL